MRHLRQDLTKQLKLTGKYGPHLHDAVDVRRLDATREGFIQVAQVIRVAIPACADTRADTSRVAMPEINEHGRDRLARRHVHKLDVQIKGHALLILNHVGANQLPINIVRAHHSFRCQNARRIVAEELHLVVS